MAIREFKIKCKIMEITQLSNQYLNNRIPLVLKEDGYNITNTSIYKIEFEPIKDSFTRIRGASQRIYRGIFILVEHGKDVQLELIYFISYEFFFLAMIVTLVLGIFSDPFDFVFGIFVLVFFLVDIFKQRHLAQQLFFKLISSDIHNFD